MLGELIYEAKGKITGYRVLDVEGPKIEVTISENGTLKGGIEIPPPTIDVNIIIVNKINNQIRKYYITITPLNGGAFDNFRTPSKTVFVL
ncbi:MAG TPA: hypothetical protein VE244_04235 [Nitrososphaeraceae archaeon]|jgi:hypothetical protein|nr:hypothetical protein [Nitrososphaeraceae archaeon]